MHVFLFMAGLIWLVWGALVLLSAVGGIHEVYGSILVSSGVLFLGLAELLRRLSTLMPERRESMVSNAIAQTAADDYLRPSQAAQEFISSGR